MSHSCSGSQRAQGSGSLSSQAQSKAQVVAPEVMEHMGKGGCGHFEENGSVKETEITGRLQGPAKRP